MSTKTQISVDFSSQEEKAFPFLNPLDGLEQLLTMHRTKKAQTPMEVETLSKLDTMITTEMVINGSDADSHNLLEMLGLWIYSLLGSILIDPRGSERAISLFLADHESDKGAHLFTLAPTTLQRHLDHLPMMDADACLKAQRETLHTLYDCFGALPTQFVASIDTSDKKFCGQFHNQYTPFAIGAQSSRPYRAIKESMIYMPQLQLAASSEIVQISPVLQDQHSASAWISQMEAFLIQSEKLRERIDLILGDRGYFGALPHAYSYLGLWNPHISIIENPRMVTPTKLWGKTDVKWTLLLNPKAPVIHSELMQLGPDQCELLRDHLEEFPCDEQGKRAVPVAIVIGFDCYRKPSNAQDLQWAHERARKIQASLEEQANKIITEEQAYTAYCETALDKTVHAPTYKGRKRVKFENECEKALYNACYSMKTAETRILRTKSKLCARLYMYSVSLHKGETIEALNSLLLSIPRQFRERWGEENGFKGIKHQFQLGTNDRSPTSRHDRWVISNLWANSWHFARYYYTLQNSSQPNSNKHFLEGILPEIRIKSDDNFPPDLTAQGYLLSILCQALNRCLKKDFKTLIKC